MHVIGSDVNGDQTPSTLGAPFDDGGEHRLSTWLIQVVGALIHASAFRKRAAEMWFEHRSALGVMVSIDGPGGIAVDARAVASERDEVSRASL